MRYNACDIIDTCYKIREKACVFGPIILESEIGLFSGQLPPSI